MSSANPSPMAEIPGLTLVVRDLGRMAYQPALAVQEEVHQAVVEDRLGPTLLLVEHDPVITVSRRKTSAQHLVATPATLARLGIDVQPTNRGGDITYHGPGQLVVYPVLRLTRFGLNIGAYMRLLEQVVITALAAFGIAGRRDPLNTGVWVEMPIRSEKPRPEPGTRNPELKKICALGVRVRKNVTLHGLALNVTTDLTHFQTIIPCGLPDRGVTSLQELLGDQTPTMERVKAEVVTALRQQLQQAQGKMPQAK